MIVSKDGKIRLEGDNNVVLSELLGIILAFAKNANADPLEVIKVLNGGVDTMEVEQQPAGEMRIVLPDKTLVDGHGNPVISDAEKLAEELTGGDDDGENESGEGQTGETDENPRKESLERLFRQGVKKGF